MKAKKNKLVWYPFHHKPGLTTIYEKETGWWILFDHFGLLIVIKKIIKVLNDSFKKKKKGLNNSTSGQVDSLKLINPFLIYS